MSPEAKALGDQPAFPVALSQLDSRLEIGLTKREWLAGMAMQGRLAMMAAADSKTDPDHNAQRAIEFAEALIEQLAKKQ